MSAFCLLCAEKGLAGREVRASMYDVCTLLPFLLFFFFLERNRAEDDRTSFCADLGARGG